ncbi:MAG: hypothetical protein B6244_01325 [Candidatus Cloacimonetes bacterium 4572_55]|nr:MAG: hypothetical protein B6244_01325 [Candidatus Cloacimonetes bacterium 4572_55]
MIITFFVILIIVNMIAEQWLSLLNRQEVEKNADEIPPAFRSVMDEATYAKAVQYTLAKNKFGFFVNIKDGVVTLLCVVNYFLRNGAGHSP